MLLYLWLRLCVNVISIQSYNSPLQVQTPCTANIELEFDLGRKAPPYLSTRCHCVCRNAVSSQVKSGVTCKRCDHAHFVYSIGLPKKWPFCLQHRILISLTICFIYYTLLKSDRIFCSKTLNRNHSFRQNLTWLHNDQMVKVH